MGTISVSISKRPPSGMASRALRQRFISTCSICVGSALMGCRDARIHLDFDVPADDFFEEASKATIDGIEIDGARLKRLPACEGQQFTSEQSSTIGLFANLRETFGDFGQRGTFFEAEFCPAKNCSNNVIEIMSDATGELTDGFKFLGLL